MHDARLSLLVISCDAYADLWAPFAELLFRYWPDCPFRVYLGSNHRRLVHPRITCLPIGEDRSWGANLRAMLDGIDSPYVLPLLEDFFLESSVDTARVERLLQLAETAQLDSLRLIPNPPPTLPLEDHPGVGVLQPQDSYRISTQAAIWRRSSLRKLALPTYSAWQFEIEGTRHSSSESLRLWGTYDRVIDYHHVVERGKWLAKGLRICRREGLSIATNSRPKMSQGETLRRSARQFRNAALRTLPQTVQNRFRQIAGRAELVAIPDPPSRLAGSLPGDVRADVISPNRPLPMRSSTEDA